MCAWYILQNLPHAMRMNQISTTWQSSHLTFTLANTLLADRAILVIIWPHTLQVAPSYRWRATKRWVSLMTGVVRMLQVTPSFRQRATTRWHDFDTGASMVDNSTRTLKVAPSYRRRAIKWWGYIS